MASIADHVAARFRAIDLRWYFARTMMDNRRHPPGRSAVLVIAVDSMLFGGTVATGGIGWAASVPRRDRLGCCGRPQRRGSPQNDLGLAAGKGLVVGLLTAIVPTAPPSPMRAPDAFDSTSAKVSPSSSWLSSRIGTRTVFSRWPTVKVSVPLVAV